MSGRVEAPLEALVGQTVEHVEHVESEGFAVLRLSGGASLYVDNPTVYVDGEHNDNEGRASR